jgi:hypothetical protein
VRFEATRVIGCRWLLMTPPGGGIDFMFAYRTPGVYFEWVDPRLPGLVPLRTDIAGFVGIAARGPLFNPVKVESWNQFITTFGAHTPQGYLAYGVDGFFANGGETCWVIRVADPHTARPASLTLHDGNNEPTLNLTASSPGAWGDSITASIALRGDEHFTLTLQLPGVEREVWRDLTMRKDDPRYVETVLNHEQTGSRLVTVHDLDSRTTAPKNIPNPRASTLRSATGRLEGGKDGLAPNPAFPKDSGLRLEHFSGQDTSSENQYSGLVLLESIDEVSIVAMPDIMPKPRVSRPTKPFQSRCEVLDSEPEPPLVPVSPSEFAPPFTPDQIRTLQHAMIGHCEKLKDRVAILDPPLLDPTQGLNPEQALVWGEQFNSTYAAFYYPWLLVADPLRLAGLVRPVPPSGHVAGIYARGDMRVGVHKPPANEIVEGAKNVQAQVEDIAHGDLNDRGVNVIRSYNGRGIRVVGARTLNKDPVRDPQWRYINVRRLLIMITEAIDEGTQWTVFEPNNPALWDEVDRVVRNFLDDLWRRGMLDGATAEEAYVVQCDETTNPPEEMEVGRLICLVGVLPPWPAEFVIVRIGKTEGGTEILDMNGGQNG